MDAIILYLKHIFLSIWGFYILITNNGSKFFHAAHPTPPLRLARHSQHSKISERAQTADEMPTDHHRDNPAADYQRGRDGETAVHW